MLFFKRNKKRQYLDEFTNDEIRDWINGKENKELDSIVDRYERCLGNKNNKERFIGFRERNNRAFKQLELDELAQQLNMNLYSDKKTSEYKEHIIATLEDDAIRLKERTIFNEYCSLYNKARELEKQSKSDEALEIYLYILDNFNPKGTAYYVRPCIILEKQKRYDEAINICSHAINAINNNEFSASVDEFEHRLKRLLEKKNKINN